MSDFFFFFSCCQAEMVSGKTDMNVHTQAILKGKYSDCEELGWVLFHTD